MTSRDVCGACEFSLPSFDPLYMSMKKGYQWSRSIVFKLIVQRAGIGGRLLKQMTLTFTTCADEVSRLSRISWPSEQIETITILEQCLGFQWHHTEHVSDGFNYFASTLFGIKTCILTKFSFSCFDHNHLVIRDVKSSLSMQIVTSFITKIAIWIVGRNGYVWFMFKVYLQAKSSKTFVSKVCGLPWFQLWSLTSRAHLCLLRMHYSHDTQRLSRASATSE